MYVWASWMPGGASEAVHGRRRTRRGIGRAGQRLSANQTGLAFGSNLWAISGRVLVVWARSGKDVIPALEVSRDMSLPGLLLGQYLRSGQVGRYYGCIYC